MKDLLAGHERIALDTSILIYHFEAHPVFGAVCASVLRNVASGRCTAIVSELSLLELIVRPLQLGRQDAADEYETLISHMPHLELVPTDRAVVRRAAALRATYALRTPDALLLATAMVHGASLVLTNDRAWKKVTEIKVVCLGDITLRPEIDGSSAI